MSELIMVNWEACWPHPALKLQTTQFANIYFDTNGPPADTNGPLIAQTLEHWRNDCDLASVRDRIDQVPEDERTKWQTSWADVAALLARAREGP